MAGNVWHTVHEGESLTALAAAYGFRDWRLVYEHPQNAALQARSGDPNLLVPGDRVFIPEKNETQFQVATGRAHRFTVKALVAFFRVHLVDDEGAPYAGINYRLDAAGQAFEGSTDADGLVEHALPVECAAAQLTAWLDGEDQEPYTWTIHLKTPPPVDDLRGVQVRLTNLGFPCRVTGVLDEETREALRDFQDDLGLEEATGEPDDATRRALAALHDPVPEPRDV